MTWEPETRVESSSLVNAYSDMQPRRQTRMEAFRSFLLRSQRYSSLGGSDRRLLLLEELPYFGKPELRRQFESIFLSFLRSSRFLLVLVLTEAREQDNSLQKTLGSDILGHPAVAHIKVNPVTSRALTTALTSIARFVYMSRYQGFPCFFFFLFFSYHSVHPRASALSTSPPLTPSLLFGKRNLKYYRAEGVVSKNVDIPAIVKQARGDIRNAIHSLQFASVQASRAGGDSSSGEDGDSSDDEGVMGPPAPVSGRDRSLSLFHSLGKVFHAKDEVVAEDVMANQELSPSLFLDYLHENYIPYMPQMDVERSVSYHTITL